MANWYEPTEEQRRSYESWLAGLPPAIREAAEKLPPWKLYRIASGHRVELMSFYENAETGCIQVTVAVRGKWNKVAFDRKVFGIAASELVECELPAADEEVGTALIQREDIEAFIAWRREQMLAETEAKS